MEVVVVDAATGEPVDGVHVRAIFPAGNELTPRVTPADGRATWARGASTVRLRIEDPRRRYYAREATFGELLSSGEPTDKGEVRIELRAGQLVELLVQSPGPEAPVPCHARVEAVPLNGARVSAATDDAGKAVIGPFAPGTLQLVVVAPGRVAQYVALQVDESRVVRREILLQPGGTHISGRVARDLEKRATEVVFRFEGVSLTTPLEPDGSFEFDGLPSGEGELIVQRRGRVLFARTVPIGDSDTDVGVLRPQS